MRACKEVKTVVGLTVDDITIIKNALYAYREMARAHERIAINGNTGQSGRDAARWSKVIAETLRIEDNIENEVRNRP